MVTGAPHVRFYAGTPLRAEGGQAIGTLCVLDRAPHPAPDPDAVRVLEDLAATIVALLDARLRERQLAAANRTARLHADLLRLSFEAPDWPTMIRAVLARICCRERGARRLGVAPAARRPRCAWPSTTSPDRLCPRRSSPGAAPHGRRRRRR